MHVSALRRLARRTGLLAGAVLALALAPASAGAATFSWSVPLSGNDVIASGLPAIGSATGSASITGDDAANRMCGTFSWSGVAAPVAFGHIHEGQYGQVENPAVTIQFFADPLGAPNPVSGCTIVPGTLIDEMYRYSAYFNVVVHNKQFPGGALRGQLGNGTIVLSKCQLFPSLCPGP
jgi:hypothetical protein